MKTHACAALLLAGTVLAPALYPNTSAAAENPAWQFTLLAESRLTDDCPICDGLVLPVPLRGAFSVRLLDKDMLYSRYSWEAIAWTADSAGGTVYKIAGEGVYQVGGEVAQVQTAFLTLTIDNGASNQICYFTNFSQALTRRWPAIQIDLVQTNGTQLQQYSLELYAAPFREIWFSTTHGFHAQIWNAPTNYVSAGDLISSAGRVIKRNQQLIGSLGIMPPVPEIGLNAVDILPGGEIAFPMPVGCFSETLGLLQNGDIVSDRGRIVMNRLALLSAFGGGIFEPGVDALQFMTNGEIYFSITNEFYSLCCGTIRRGDLVSSRGAVVKRNEELLADFPSDPKLDYGLDAIYVWPDGEIWFSVETGFTGPHFEPYMPGGLLSDRGYVVYHNLDLLAAFQPMEDLADFGLDALFVVTDLAATPDSAGALRLSQPVINPMTGKFALDWAGQGKVYQIEKATNISGPWLPLSPILVGPPVEDQITATNAQGFYRVRQW